MPSLFAWPAAIHQASFGKILTNHNFEQVLPSQSGCVVLPWTAYPHTPSCYVPLPWASILLAIFSKVEAYSWCPVLQVTPPQNRLLVIESVCVRDVSVVLYPRCLVQWMSRCQNLYLICLHVFSFPSGIFVNSTILALRERLLAELRCVQK